jgi:DNA-binding transcriptional ArsR family regulator
VTAYQLQDEVRAFRALADATRRQILEDLREGELAAGEIAGRFAMTAPSVSKHLRILREAELISERREGNRILYALCQERLALCLGRFLSAVCPEQIVLRHTRWKEGEQP